MGPERPAFLSGLRRPPGRAKRVQWQGCSRYVLRLGICVKECATQAITGERKKLHRIDQVKCMRCGTCVVVCPPKISAVEKHSPLEAAAS